MPALASSPAEMGPLSGSVSCPPLRVTVGCLFPQDSVSNGSVPPVGADTVSVPSPELYVTKLSAEESSPEKTGRVCSPDSRKPVYAPGCCASDTREGGRAEGSSCALSSAGGAPACGADPLRAPRHGSQAAAANRKPAADVGRQGE